MQLAINGGVPIRKMPSLKSPIDTQEIKAINKLLQKNGAISSFRGGDEVRQFEKDFAKYVGTTYAIATTSGTTALHAAVSALNLSPEDEVLVPALTFVSTASVVLQEGAKVVFVDIDEYFCMDPDDLRKKITKNSRAIIPVHLYGQPAEMDQINAIAKKHSLVVIEDACQSHGASYKSKRTGSLGDIGCFSFFQTKNMTTGEGGMITTSNERLYKLIRLAREHGSPADSETWYNYKRLGYNYNMTELQGTIGKIQLKKLDKMNDARREKALLYDNYLAALGLTLPKVRSSVIHARHNYPVLLPPELRYKRDFFVKAVAAEGIPIDVAYPHALYQTDLFKEHSQTANCPKAEDYASRLFTLFTDQSIDEAIIRDANKAIKKVLNFIYEKV